MSLHFTSGHTVTMEDAHAIALSKQANINSLCTKQRMIPHQNLATRPPTMCCMMTMMTMVMFNLKVQPVIFLYMRMLCGVRTTSFRRCLRHQRLNTRPIHLRPFSFAKSTKRFQELVVPAFLFVSMEVDNGP